MKIGVLAEAGDTCARELAETLADVSGRDCPFFDLTVPASARVAMDHSAISWDGADLTALDKLVVCGFDYQDPLVPRPKASAEWSLWQIDYIVDQQRWSFVSSVLRDLERRGVALINSWHALQFGFAKARLLAELKHAGFSVPQWVCTNDMPVAQRFCEQNKRVVWRPTTGRAMWQLFLDKQRLHLVDPSKPPILLATHPEQPLRRAFICGDEVLLGLNCSVPHLSPFEEMEEVWAGDCSAVRDELVRAVSQTHARWAQVLFVEQNGRPCIYDIDIDPRYGWLPAEFRAYLQIRLARKLLDLPPPDADTLTVPARRQRDSLFVRRMLTILHEMEATKYAPDPPDE